MENGRIRNVRVGKPYEQVTSDKKQPFTSERKGSLLLVIVDKELFSTEKSLKAICLSKFNSLISTPLAFHLDPCFLADTARHLQSAVELQATETKLTGGTRLPCFCRGPCGLPSASENPAHCWENLGLTFPALRMVSLRLLVPSIYTVGSFAFGCKEEMPQQVLLLCRESVRLAFCGSDRKQRGKLKEKGLLPGVLDHGL